MVFPKLWIDGPAGVLLTVNYCSYMQAPIILIKCGARVAKLNVFEIVCRFQWCGTDGNLCELKITVGGQAWSTCFQRGIRERFDSQCLYTWKMCVELERECVLIWDRPWLYFEGLICLSVDHRTLLGLHIEEFHGVPFGKLFFRICFIPNIEGLS